MGSKVSIVTAQNVEIQYEVADIGKRFLGHLIDFLVKTIYVSTVILVLSNVAKLGGHYSFYTYLGIIICIPLVFYSFIFERFNDGQSLGKKAMKIKVVSIDGSPTTTGQFLIRWLFRILDIQSFYGLVAIISIITGEKGQRLGDRVANTCVILLSNPSTVEKTSYAELKRDYVPRYQEAAILSAQDITTIKEVLADRSERSFLHLTDTASHLETLLEIRKDGSSKDFLNTIIKDYNYFQTREQDLDDIL